MPGQTHDFRARTRRIFLNQWTEISRSLRGLSLDKSYHRNPPGCESWASRVSAKILKTRRSRIEDQDRSQPSLVVLLDTGMRISETLRITIDQYDGKYFRIVKRKGKRRDAVYLSPEVRAAIKDYFDEERGRGAGPLFQSRNGEPMLRKDAERYLKQISAMSNANVPDDKQVSLHSHLMRRTGLKRRNRSGQGRLPGLSLVRAESIWPYR
jgi:integrase